jgi:hypothetical protein
MSGNDQWQTILYGLWRQSHPECNMLTAGMMLLRSARHYASSQRIYAPLLCLTSSQCAAQTQTRSLITIKKFYRETAPAPAKKTTSPKAASTSDTTAPTTGKPMRLAKRIALAGVCSRREAEKIIQANEVSVNGTIVSDLSTNVDLERDAVVVQGRPIPKAARRKVWMANKLPGVRMCLSVYL